MKKNIWAVAIVVIICAVAAVWYAGRQNNAPVEEEKSFDRSESSDQDLNEDQKFIARAVYVCDGGKTADASFYEGEPVFIEPGQMPIPAGSVKVVLDDGRDFDLPQTISASGARYANEDGSFIFWNKGDSVMIFENGEEKDYINCTALPAND